MTHIQNLEIKISKLKDELLALTDQAISVQEQIGAEMREIVPNEVKVDKLQIDREAISRREERIKIRLRATEDQRPYALKKDGEVLLYSTADRLKVFAEQAAKTVPLLEKAIDEVIKVAEGAYQPYINSLPISSDMEILCIKHGISRLAKANVIQISPGKVQNLVDHFTQLDKEFKSALKDESRRYADKLAAIKK